MTHIETVRTALEEGAKLKMLVASTMTKDIVLAGHWAAEVLRTGNKIMVCGNGGSAGDAQHIVAEYVGRFRRERQALPAIALTVDTSVLTCIGNDYGFDSVFSRQLEGLGTRGDLLIAISTSGNSGNIISAVKAAKAKGIRTVGLLGRQGGALRELVDLPLIVPADDTARIQEVHIALGHLICQVSEELLS